MGKLNAYHAVTDVLGTTAVRDIPADEPAVWPNPTTGLLHIPCPDNGSLEPIRITDALGRTLHAPALPGRESITLDIADWPAGIYLIHFLSHGKRVAAKVVKA
jgi:hypothetical protein